MTIIFVVWRIFNYLIDIYSWILVAYALMSWVPALRFSVIGRFITRLAAPYLSLFERLPLRFAGLDFSVWVALASLWLIERFVGIVLQWLLML